MRAAHDVLEERMQMPGGEVEEPLGEETATAAAVQEPTGQDEAGPTGVGWAANVEYKGSINNDDMAVVQEPLKNVSPVKIMTKKAKITDFFHRITKK